MRELPRRREPRAIGEQIPAFAGTRNQKKGLRSDPAGPFSFEATGLVSLAMKKLIPLAMAAATALVLSTAAAAQSAQERLDDRYNFALAAGYKAMMLCSAIANAELNGTSRTAESVHAWELSGIQPPLDTIVRDLPYEIVRTDAGHLRHVRVTWTDDMPPRVARHDSGYGCVNLPIGTDPEKFKLELEVLPRAPESDNKGPFEGLRLEVEGEAGEFLDALSNSPVSATLDKAFSQGYGQGRTTAVVIRTIGQSGEMASQTERYASGFDENTPQRTWSVSKSIAATLVGAAVHSDEACISDTMLTQLTKGTSEPRRDVTVDHLLRMASGRYSDTPGNRTDPLYWGGTTVDERAANWPLVRKPGTVYRYANNDTLMAVQAIECFLEKSPPSEFFAKLGMNHTIAETDWQGNYILSSQVWSTALDLAQLGHLYLNDGVWNGERLIPSTWLEYVSAPSGPQPEGRSWGYGAGWWLLNKEEGIPADTILAAGNRGQYIVVVPSRGVVIVRRGEDMVGTRFDIVAFARDVLAALEE